MDSKLDTIPQLEVILSSIDLNNRLLFDNLLKAEELDTAEKHDINKYLKLLEISGKKPSLDLLRAEFPSRNFDVQPVSLEQVNDYINLYLYNKKNINLSKTLLELSSKVRGTGVTEGILDSISTITKSDSIRHKFTNIKDDIVDRYENQEYKIGLKTGVNFIDKITGGIHKGEVNTVIAYAGHCKTTFAINAAYNAMKLKQNVLYLSLEVSKEEVYWDFVSRHSNESDLYNRKVEHYKLKKRKLKPDEWEYTKNHIIPGLDSTIEGKVYVVDETELDNYSFFSLESKFREVEKLAVEETGHGIDMVVVDHIQLLKFGLNKPSSAGEAINEYVSWFRQLSIDWLKLGRGVAIVLLSQTNRNGYSEALANNGKYTLTSIAEANELERASTLIISIFAEKEMKELGLAKVQILKYRDAANEDEPTEVNIDLAYYLFGDLDSEGITPQINENTQDVISGIINGETIENTFAGISLEDLKL